VAHILTMLKRVSSGITARKITTLTTQEFFKTMAFTQITGLESFRVPFCA